MVTLIEGTYGSLREVTAELLKRNGATLSKDQTLLLRIRNTSQDNHHLGRRSNLTTRSGSTREGSLMMFDDSVFVLGNERRDVGGMSLPSRARLARAILLMEGDLEDELDPVTTRALVQSRPDLHTAKISLPL